MGITLMIITKTPLRVSFAGGGTDLASFYRANDYGAVLSTSINSYLYVTLKKQSPLYFEKYRLNYSETELVDDVEKIKNSIIRECIKFLEIDDCLYISTISEVPASTGLGSSSTFCVGLLNALYKFKGEPVSAGRLAEEAAHVEIDILKRPMGKQDHYAAAFGGLNYIRFNSDDSVTIEPIQMSAQNLKKLSESVIMFWTGITRPSESVLKEQDERNIENTKVLITMRDQASRLSKILVESDLSIRKLGTLMHEGWELKKTLSSAISNDLIDNSYNTAKEYGSYGGKISGAGGGGFITLVAEPTTHGNLIHALANLGLKRHKFSLDSEGTTVYKMD
jgi:D-glycero-alpha-D-manno-heptose-7-phosphate kinase